uniref:Uncharacterized protein n=1 Tax=Amphimedon queenslandica TaxID=400682 RepID=A0A1X7UKN4_AMPQE
MEVDERLRWLESRVNSSLRPKGEKLRTFFADSDNRLRFLDFCNNSETRHLFVHLPTESEESTGACTLRVSPHPPDSIHTKALFFIKNTHTSRLNKETIGNEVVCSECSEDPIEHLELVLREVYLPLLAEQKEGAAASSAASAQGISPERIMDILHRMISNIQVTQGHLSGDLVLPIPSLDILVEGAASSNNERRAVVVHIMESCVISWMKQVKMAMHFDPNGAIAKSNGKMAGPIAEIKYWENRYQQLLLVRNQLNSVEVLRILNGLEHARSTYADAFIDVHRDMEKSIIDTELSLMYISTLKPLFLKLEGAFSPDTLTDLFPSLVTTLSLVWQHSKVYAQSAHFSRLLRLISNKLALKAKDIVGVDPLENPIESCVCIRQALRICSAFRGYYLDRRDVAERVIGQNKDRLNQIQQESIHQTRSKESTCTFDQDSAVGDSSIVSFSRQGHHSIDYPLCSWPPRNSPVFTSLNSTLERCNDLLELVQTMEHFSELALVAAQGSSEGKDPILIDVYHQFQVTLDHFRKSTKDLMSLEEVGFEKSFFVFRSSVKELEGRLSQVLFCYFDDCLLLEPSLRLLESFQGLISRESIQSVLSPKLEAIIDTIQADVTQIKDCMTSFVTDPPLIPNTPATPSKLLWLRALRERMDVPIERVREAAPYLLHGEKGFLLRHAHSKIIKAIEQQWNSVVSSWKKSIPESIDNALLCTLLKQDKSSGELQVNFSLSLEKVLRELHYMRGPLLSVPVPQVINSLSVTLSPHTLHQYRVSLEVYMRQYNSMQETLDTVHKGLFQQKLSLLDKLLEEGLGQLNWLSVEVPDFLAKLKASLQTDLLPAVQCVLQQTDRIRSITGSWTDLVTLDMFRDTERSSLDLLANMYSELVEIAKRVLCSSMIQIEGLFKKAYQRVEVSWDSPAWSGYLYYLDCLVVKGLKQMILHSMNTLISRAQKYEQGGSIPPMVTVSLELYEKDIEFSPPLSARSSLPSVPERIKQYLEGFVSLSKSLHSRLYPLSTESYYQLMSSDPEVLGNLQKITAHVETSARQCQSLRKRFSQYSFLWEQDVLATFDDFINGVGQPHPRRFTRPETVNRSRSASARSRGHSAAPPPMSSQTASSVLESVTGHSDWEFLKPDRQYSAPPSSSPSNTPPSTSRSSSSSETGLIKDGRRPRHPTLEDFDGEIAVFQGVLERLSSSIDTVDVGWICVDQRAVKNALTSLAKKWTYIYANYLEKKVLLVLRELEVFFTEIEPQVEAISGDTVDPDHIMTLVTIFNKVNLQQLVMDGKFGAVHRAVSILDKFHQTLPAQTRDHFEGIPHRWSSLKKRLALSKQRIAPLIQSHSAAIKRDLEVFGSEAEREHQSFLSSPCLSHNCDPPVAQDLIKEYVQILLGLRAQAKDLMELQELLQASVVNFSILNQFEDELTNANLLWERQHMISEYHTNIKTQIWLNVDFSDMKDTCREHTELLMSLGDCTGDWDARTHFQEAVYEMQHTVPLLEGLSNKHMRPRHWKQVLRYSNNHSLILLLMKNGTLDMNVLRHMTVGRFMELKLLSYSADILGIVDRASKEVAIEELLKNLEEVWLSMQFQLKPFYRLHGHEQAASDIGVEAGRISALSHTSPVVRKRSISSGRVSIISATPTVAVERMTHHHHQHEVVMLLDDVDKIFEALDHYQTSLKSLEGSVAATSFSEELQHWHKQLQTVEAVLRVWLQVQTHWVQLEEVLTSIEAAQHLPSTYFNFTTINKEWKQLLKSTAKSPNVIQCCLQEDLLQMLEKFLNTLTQCQSVLLQYVQCKSSRCPWLYFLTLEDVLQLVCYSSNLPVLCKVIPKLFLHSTGLLFSNDISLLPIIRSSSLLPRITGLTGYGREKLELAEGVDCDGAIEIILNHLLHSVTETLNQQLITTLTQQKSAPSTPSQSSTTPSLIKRLSSVWLSSSSHQILQLATIILLEERLQQEVENTKGGSLDPSSFLSDIQSAIQTLESIHEGKVTQEHDPKLGFTDSNKGIGQLANNSAENEEEDAGWSDTQLDLKSEPVAIGIHKILYHNLMLILLTYRQRAKALSTEPHPSSSFQWLSSLHYSHDATQRSCVLSTIGASLNYGFHYSGGYPIALTTPTESMAVHMVKVMSQQVCGVITNDTKSDSVSTVSIACGYPLFPLQCSNTTSNDTLMNCFKGIASTGSWLYLSNLHSLPVSLIQLSVQLMTAIREAKIKRSRIVKFPGESLKAYKLDTSFCIASTTLSSTFPSLLSSSVFSVFKTYSIQEAPPSVTYEALFISNGFVSAVSPLSLFLSRYTAENNINKTDACALISLSSQHIKDYHHHYGGSHYQQSFEPYLSLSPPPPTTLSSSVASSVILSHLTQSSHDSLATSRQGGPALPVLVEEDEENEDDVDLREESSDSLLQKLELLSVLVSIWELQLPLPPAALQSMQEYFSDINVSEVLEELDKGQAEIVSVYAWSREAVESAQESRAASAMLSTRGRNTNLHNLESAILQACLVKGLVPSQHLLKSVHTLVQLILLNRVVRVIGNWEAGRREVIELAIEVIKSTGYTLSNTSLPTDAIYTGGLLGEKDVPGVLPQLLNRLSPSSTNSIQLILLEEGSGPLCETEEGLSPCLQWICNENETLLYFTNNASTLLDPSVKFILTCPSTGDVSRYLPTLSLTHDCCISWEHRVKTSFLPLDRDIQKHLTLLSQQHIPGLIDLMYNSTSDSDSTAVYSYVSLSVHQLVSSLCNVLKCLLSDVTASVSSSSVERVFAYALIWTFGSTMTSDGRRVFEVWLRESFPESLTSLDESLWHYKLIPASLNFDLCRAESTSGYVYCPKRKALSEFIQLLYTKNIHLVLDGVCGSGKTAFLVDTITASKRGASTNSSNASGSSSNSNDPMYSFMHTHVNQLSSPATFWSQLQENLVWHSGRTYLPQSSDKVVILVDDIHLSQVSHSGSLLSLIVNHISTGTILAPPSYKEHNVGGITYILSTDSTQCGLDPETISNILYLHWEEYSEEELVFIYSALLGKYFTGLSYSLLTQLVETSVQIHTKLQTTFIDNKDRKHYTFTSTVLDATLRSLTLRCDRDISPIDLLQCWLSEKYWHYAAQLTTTVDRERYQECVDNALKKYFSESPLLPTLLQYSPLSFGIGKKQMEDKLISLQQELDALSPTPPLSLYDFTLTLSLHLSHLLEEQRPLSSILLIGMGHIEHLLLLITASLGYSLQRPSQIQISNTTSTAPTGATHVIGEEGISISPSICFQSDGDIGAFRAALKSIYTNAGVKNERVVIFLDDQELLHPSCISLVYEFVKDCSINMDFNPEERSRIVNSLRSEVTRNGSEYSEQKAWIFFINRLKTNVRLVLSLPDLELASNCGLLGMKNLLSVIEVCYELPWDRKKLLHVANYHLKNCVLPKTLQESTAHLLTSLHMLLRNTTADTDPVSSYSSHYTANPITVCCCWNNKFEFFSERFCHELEEWWRKLSSECHKLDTAIEAFSKTQRKLLSLKERLIREEIVLEEKGKSYAQLLVQIGQDTAIAKEQLKLVYKQSERIEHLQKVLPEYEHVYSLYVEDLERIEHETKEIALNLDQKSLLVLRSLHKPPLDIQELLEAVIIIIKSPGSDLSWTKGAKRLMANIDRFKEMMMEFSQHREASGPLLESLQLYISRPGFNEETFSKLYLAAGQLCSWVKGVENFHRMLQDNIRRLEYRKSQVKVSLQEYTEKLTQLNHKVQVLDERLEGLSSSLEQASIEKTYQNEIVMEMGKELEKTTQFIESLSSHYNEWNTVRDNLSGALTSQIGQLALTTCYTSYLTSLDPQQALNIVTHHVKPSILDKGFTLSPHGGIPPLQGIIMGAGDSGSSKIEEQQENTSSSTGGEEREEESTLKCTGYQYHDLFNDVLLMLNPIQSLQSLPSLSLLHHLYAVLVEHAWNRWTLLYDPDNIATSLLSDKWSILDGQEWSVPLFHSIEQALVEGLWIVLKNISLPFHSSLIPILESGLYWQKTDKRDISLDFCGRRIHVNKSFRLILTLSSLPPHHSTSQIFSCRFNFINASTSSLPLAQELTLQEAQKDANSDVYSLDSYNTLMSAIAESDEKRRELSERLLRCLGSVTDGIVNCYIVSQVEDVMKSYKELQESFGFHCQSAETYSVSLMNTASSVCLFSSLVFSFLQWLSKATPNFLVTWSRYQSIFCQALLQSNLMKTQEVKGEAEEKRQASASTQFRQLLVKSVLIILSRCFDDTQLYPLAYCLYILSFLDSYTDVSVAQVEYILLSVGQENYWTDFLNESPPFQLSPVPEGISETIMLQLYSLPLFPSFMESVHQSMVEQPDEWKALIKNSSVLPPISSIPVLRASSTEKESTLYTLNDLVLMSILTPDGVCSYIENEMSGLMDSLPVPLLSDVLKSEDSTSMVLLYDENNLVSQANVILLNEHFRKGQSGVDGQSLLTVSVSLESESSTSSIDCVILQDIHLLGMEALALKLQKETRRVITTMDHRYSMPVQLLAQCQVLSLSRVAPTTQFQKQKSLLPQLSSQSNEVPKYLYTLLAVVSCIPQHLLEELDKVVPQKKRKLVFLLCAFHTHCYCSFFPAAQLHNLVYALSQLSKDESDIDFTFKQ